MVRVVMALEANQMWALETLSMLKKPIDCKWICKVKYKLDCIIERYKACLVANNFTQIEDLDFRETFALDAKLVLQLCEDTSSSGI